LRNSLKDGKTHIIWILKEGNEMKDYKEYKIIEVIDNMTLLINYGFNDGAKKGDTLRIIDKGAPLIIDGIDYGTFDAVKDIVEVEIPYEKFSLCRNIVYAKTNFLNPLASFEKTMRSLRPMNVDEKSVSNRELPQPSPIKKGDIVLLTNE
jgi:hypothetical protein